MIVAVPGRAPDTVPPAVIGAIAGVELLQVPPGVASVRVEKVPWQKLSVPKMAVGNGFTVTSAVIRQPVGKVYVMVAVPVPAPVTQPVELTEAIALLLELHEPPGVASVRQFVSPRQMLMLPEIAAGNGSTVTTTEMVQPSGDVAVMMEVPPPIPVTTPVPGSIVATPVLLLLHVTPGVASVNVTVLPWHNSSGPLMFAGVLTVTTRVAGQPEATYIMLAVPAIMPVTQPEEFTVATAVLSLLHVPPGVASVKQLIAPLQKLLTPVIGAGRGLMVTPITFEV